METRTSRGRNTGSRSDSERGEGKWAKGGNVGKMRRYEWKNLGEGALLIRRETNGDVTLVTAPGRTITNARKGQRFS